MDGIAFKYGISGCSEEKVFCLAVLGNMIVVYMNAVVMLKTRVASSISVAVYFKAVTISP